uniref:Uncharacterized protein n=1 Tax=Rhizophora mucronata TaxID=61149 RepID=A0A2P2NCB7_RHIMU
MRNKVIKLLGGFPSFRALYWCIYTFACKGLDGILMLCLFMLLNFQFPCFS